MNRLIACGLMTALAAMGCTNTGDDDDDDNGVVRDAGAGSSSSAAASGGASSAGSDTTRTSGSGAQSSSAAPPTSEGRSSSSTVVVSSSGVGSSAGTPSSGTTASSVAGASSSGPPAGTTIASIKALVAANNSCAFNTSGSTCPYNAPPYTDVTLENVVVMSVEHSDFDNTAQADGGRRAQRAVYVAQSLTAAENEGIEVVAPTFFELPALVVGDTVTLTGSIRTNFGNTYIRPLTMTKTGSAGTSATPVSVTPEQAGNPTKGAENADGGCANANAEQTLTGEGFEGALMDVALADGGALISYRRNTDGGVVRRFSLENGVVVTDFFNALATLQTDGGTPINPGDRVTKLRGYGYYSFGCRKIVVRSLEDITVVGAAD